MSSLVTNTGYGPITLPAPYGGVILAAGAGVLLADEPATVRANLGEPAMWEGLLTVGEGRGVPVTGAPAPSYSYELSPQTSCPIPAGSVGFWTDSTAAAFLRLGNGTDIDLSTGGGGGTGDFVFTANRADLAAPDQMEFGGPNTTHFDFFNTSNARFLRVYDPGDGSARFESAAGQYLALHGGVTDMFISSTGIECYGALLMQAGVGGVDMRAAANLQLGVNNANAVTIGKVGTPVSIPDTATVSGLNATGAIQGNSFQRYAGADVHLFDSGGSFALTLGGAATSLGFYGSAGVALQTGVAVTAAAIHAALVALGLITA